MEKNNMAFLLVLISLSCTCRFYFANAQQQKQTERNLGTYIVHVQLPDLAQILSETLDLRSYYQSYLPEFSLASTETSSYIIYSYNHVLSGFAAKLTPEDVKAMENKVGFLSARPAKILDLHTTHTPSFLGLHQNLGFWNDSNYGKGVIIGIIDSGVTASHPSFHDEGMSPPPKKWKGKCELGVLCNNKIIGARSFESNSMETPIDYLGHGTHTASTAAGNFVKGANLYGEANGTAAGMAPLAHLSIYKICTHDCLDVDILAAMDAAVDDGVDVLSLSVGRNVSEPFHSNALAVGAFTAIQKGIFVSISAGNDGPHSSSVKNEAPWYLTVGASTIDRKIRSTAMLGNGEEYDGETLIQPRDFQSTMLPLVYAGSFNNPNSTFCCPGAFNNVDIKGKVVLCMIGGCTNVQERVVKDAGGAAMIVMNQEKYGYFTQPEPYVLPVVQVYYAAGVKIKEYIDSTSTPTAEISFKGTIIGEANAPKVAYFSSRGPSVQSPGILKPDIIGPGVNILAAWPYSIENETGSISTFNIISGTSMSCPHLSGIAALLKSVHPDWSPAAIKSAIMTTADITNLRNNLIQDEVGLLTADVFATGSGHVNPSRASKPGLIYDIKPYDYIPYLCSLNYTDEEIEIITNRRVKCSEMTIIQEKDLNYPSFSVSLESANRNCRRTVTNVGPSKSSYVSFVINPPGVEITVKPQKLEFTKVNQELSYEVTFSRLVTVPNSTFVQGYLLWSSTSGEYIVRSPISIQLI